MYTVTYREMERAAIALLTANVDKECEFTRYLKHLLAQPNVEKYMKGAKYQAGKLPIDQAQCDHQARWRNFSLAVFEKPPNICCTHLTGKLFLFQSRYHPDFFVFVKALPLQHFARSVF